MIFPFPVTILSPRPDWDLNDFSYTGDSVAVGGTDSAPQGGAYNNDGTVFFLLGANTDTIYEMDLTTPYRISTATFNGNELSVTLDETNPTGMAWSRDGKTFFLSGATDDAVDQYNAPTPFTIVGATFVKTFDVSSETTSPRGMAVNHDGTKFFVVGGAGFVFQYSFGSPYDLAGSSFDSVSLDTSTEDNVPTGMFWQTNGKKLFVLGIQNDSLFRYDTPDPFTLNGASFDTGQELDVSSEDGIASEAIFDPRGLIMTLTGLDNDVIFEYDTT